MAEWYRYQVADVFTKMMEQRHQVLRESPSLQHAQERIAAAAGVTFATKIVGYSSIALDLTTGSFGELAKPFDGNFDSFPVFLDAFVPIAFADVFSEAFADRLDFVVTVPSSLEQAFQARAGNIRSAAAPAQSQSGQSQPSSSARERAEWLWRLTNGALIVPVLLSLFVMHYGHYGLRMLSDIRPAQHDAMRPILEHQLKLLEQDRLRLL